MHLHVNCVSFSAIPGLLLAVTQSQIQYNDLTERALDMFFSILENSVPLLNIDGGANIKGTCIL